MFILHLCVVRDVIEESIHYNFQTETLTALHTHPRHPRKPKAPTTFRLYVTSLHGDPRAIWSTI